MWGMGCAIFYLSAAHLMQRWCQLNAIELVLIAEAPPILCKDSYSRRNKPPLKG